MSTTTTRPDAPMGAAPRKFPGAALLLLPLLAACSGLGFGFGGDKARQTETASLQCPRVAILRDAAEVTDFRPGGGRDLTDVVTRAALVDFQGGCEPRGDTVTVNVNLVLTAEKGPALRAEQATYRYFVAVTDAAGDILAKQEFDATVRFGKNQNRAGSVEELRQTIPLGAGRKATDYQVLVGFQLSPEQLQFNRAGKPF